MSNIAFRRSEQRRLFSTSTMLPDICIDLRSSLNGAAEPLGKQRTTETYRFLQLVVETWEPSSSTWTEDLQIDDLVLQLVKTTLEYVQNHFPQRLE
jgi:hypothetical protein